MTDPRITRNAAQCRKCGDLIVSRNRHDFVRCGCGAIAVDGGMSYLKRTGDIENIIELSEYEVKSYKDLCDND